MPWFMDPSPDGDTIHQVAAALRSASEPYNTQMQCVQSTHETAVTVWTGPGSVAHTGMTTRTQQVAQQHAAWLVALADTFMVLGTLCKLITTLQLAWLAIQAATILAGIFTAGLDTLATEGPAAALAATIQSLKVAVTELLRALERALANQLIRAGAYIGGAAGVMVGVQNAQQNHLDGWQAALSIAGDAKEGALAGVSMVINPFALIGTAVGAGQDATGGAKDTQSAFENITTDTGATDFLSGSESDGESPSAPQPDHLPRGAGATTSSEAGKYTPSTKSVEDTAELLLEGLDAKPTDPSPPRRDH